MGVEDYDFEDLSELREAVEQNGDLLALPMWSVRQAYGAERLGRVVRENIAKELSSVGLGTLPKELPSYQDDEVRVYRLGSGVADLIDAVARPSSRGDARLREAASGDASTQLDQIREIVCG